MDNNRTYIQAIWGAALLIMGVAVFFRIPYILLRVSNLKQYAAAGLLIRLSLYIMSVLLVGGGIKKIYSVLKANEKK